MILVPISIGELLDKITILKIKREKIKDNDKLANVNKEYELLTQIMNNINIDESNFLFKDLYELNLRFWEYHDWQREKWNYLKNKSDFIDLELYKKNEEEHIMNDSRAEIKKKINKLYNSDIVEEKQFISYAI
jgi:hypothetical protein